MVQTLNQLVQQVDVKCDIQRFEDFETDQVRETNSLKEMMLKKSNIKDVCALLDMKSSKLQSRGRRILFINAENFVFRY